MMTAVLGHAFKLTKDGRVIKLKANQYGKAWKPPKLTWQEKLVKKALPK
jgi:hypothetical protein